jgi:hypothetical protein
MRLRLILAVVVTAACICAQSARAHHFRYTADLKGSTVSPPSGSTALGHVVVIIDEDLHTMQILTEFNGLAGAVTEAHLHGPTAEVFAGTADIITPSPAPAGFPTGVTSGNYISTLFDLESASSFDPAFVAAHGPLSTDPMQAMFDALDAGKAYFDIHTTAFPNGEIRGFVVYVPGDFNDDGIVDAADYVIWKKTEGTIAEGHPADANNSNVVDQADYLIWRQNFGETRHDQHEHHHDHGSGTGLAENIPEPSTLTLLSVALFASRRSRYLRSR